MPYAFRLLATSDKLDIEFERWMSWQLRRPTPFGYRRDRGFRKVFRGWLSWLSGAGS